MKKLKLGNAVLCEHVVQGASNKHILINTYSGDIVVDAIPGQLMFGIYIEVELPRNDTNSILIDMAYNGTTQVSARAVMVAGKGGDRGVVVLPLVPISIEAPGIFEVTLSSPGFARTIAVRKSITEGDTTKYSSATLQPSEQSPPAVQGS